MKRFHSSFALFIVAALLLLTSCATTSHVPGTEPVSRAINYEKLGLDSRETQIWEDGLRTSGKAGSFEWWYTDTKLENGMTIVVVFFTKNGFDVPGQSQPTVSMELTYPDGTRVSRKHNEERGTLIQASKEKADVRIGNSYLRYVDGDYVLHYDDGEVVYHAQMESRLPMYRPGTGHNYYGNEGNYFAWFVAQPDSHVKAELTMDGKSQVLSGEGYHDHNWGNVDMTRLLNHWYWGRAKVGDYVIISSDVISSQQYGYKRMPSLMIAKNGKILKDGEARPITVTREDTVPHPETGKFMDNRLIYTQQIGDRVYQVVYEREDDILNISLLTHLGLVKRILATLVGANPTYTRITGKVTVKELSMKGEILVEETSNGLWEQMFFGSNTEAYIY